MDCNKKINDISNFILNLLTINDGVLWDESEYVIKINRGD